MKQMKKVVNEDKNILISPIITRRKKTLMYKSKIIYI